MAKSTPRAKAPGGKVKALVKAGTARPLPTVKELVSTLKKMGAGPVAARASMKRFGIVGETADTAFGVAVGEIRALGKSVRGPTRGRTDADCAAAHALAQELWQTGQYESRILACFVDEPSLVTVTQMDRWAETFRDWAVCDTACFHLFDKSPLCDPPGRVAYGRVRAWAGRPEEFVKRAGFALLASLALHDKQTEDDVLAGCLPLIERHATDPRNFVKKGVNWALRAIGKRSPGLRKQAVMVAERLGESKDPAARWVGKDALRELKRR